MEWEQVYTIIERFGLPVALLLLYVYLDIKRRQKDEQEKDDLVARLAALEEYNRKELQQLILQNTEAFREHVGASREMSTAAREQAQIHRQLITAMRTRPCLTDTIDQINGA